jgi:hypothetical protein
MRGVHCWRQQSLAAKEAKMEAVAVAVAVVVAKVGQC